MSYAADLFELYWRAAVYADKSSRVPNPVEQATKFELVINLKIAKALNLAIPRWYSCGRQR